MPRPRRAHRPRGSAQWRRCGVARGRGGGDEDDLAGLRAAASASRSPSAACRAGQSRAAAQPSSMTRMIGPVPARRACGFNSGWAAATITSAASTMRSRISHHGVRDGVSSRGASPSNSRIAGKSMRRGAGGVTRSSHQMIGNPASASSSQGEAKAREPNASIVQRTAAETLAKSRSHRRRSPDSAS